MSNQSNINQRAWLGIVLVAIGGFFLLRNFDLIPDFLPYWIFSWKTIFVLVGGSMLVTGRREGFVFLAIGGLFLLPDLFDVPRFRFREIWPVILIIIGISIVLRRRDSSHRGLDVVDEDFFEDTAIFGGSEKSFTSQNFQGGKITSVFGGSDIDFSNAKLADGEVVLDIFCLFGGNNFRVPNDWTVINESFVIFGGYSDKRINLAENDPSKVLRIKGSVIFGGAEVKGA